MGDKFSTEERSKIMAKIKSRNTKVEIIVRKALHGAGLRYRIHKKELPGTPDIVFTKYKTAIFVNGCFWHGHQSCNKFKYPITNQDYWSNKILRNISRDKENEKFLKEMGWKVLVIWECEIFNVKDQQKNELFERLIKEITIV